MKRTEKQREEDEGKKENAWRELEDQLRKGRNAGTWNNGIPKRDACRVEDILWGLKKKKKNIYWNKGNNYMPL